MLHIVNKSPFEKNSLATCLRLAKAGSCVLLIEDAVYGALRSTALAEEISANQPKYKFYVLLPDLKARGLAAEKLIDGIEVVSYREFVHLAVRCDTLQSWL